MTITTLQPSLYRARRGEYRSSTVIDRRGVEEQSDIVTRQILDAVVREGVSLTLISAPPGAGKTYIVETLACVLSQYDLGVVIVTPRASQQNALLERLLANFVSLGPIQVLQSSQRCSPPCLAWYPGRVSVTSDARCLKRGAGIVLSTVAKLFDVMQTQAGCYDVLICDEAWQVSYHSMAPLLGAARQNVLIGDPGQLAPLIRTKVPTTAPLQVHLPAPETLLQQHPDALHIRLPYSRRLTQGAVDLIQPAFYPKMVFKASTLPSERRLALSGKSTGSAVDRTLDLLADGASMVSLVLPRRPSNSIGVDEELAQVEASLVRRLLDRKARWEGNRILKDVDFGCVNSRVSEGATLRKHLRNQGISTDNVWTETGEVWQGQERNIVLARHAASGLTKLSAFDLEVGRTCVMLSRASLCTILTYREGLSEALQAHTHDCSARELGEENTIFRGWSAHVSLLAAIESSGQMVRMQV